MLICLTLSVPLLSMYCRVKSSCALAMVGVFFPYGSNMQTNTQLAWPSVTASNQKINPSYLFVQQDFPKTYSVRNQCCFSPISKMIGFLSFCSTLEIKKVTDYGHAFLYYHPKIFSRFSAAAVIEIVPVKTICFNVILFLTEEIV